MIQISNEIMQFVKKIMEENRGKTYDEIMKILEIKLRTTALTEEEIKTIIEYYSRGFYGNKNLENKQNELRLKEDDYDMDVFTYMTNFHHEQLVEQEKTEDMIRRVEYFETPLEEARKKSVQKGSAKKKQGWVKITAIVLAIITVLSTLAITIKVNEEKLYKLIQTAVIEHKLEATFKDVSKQVFPFLLDDHDYEPKLDQEKLVDNYNVATQGGAQFVPGLPNYVSVIAGAEIMGDDKGNYGDELAEQAAKALTGKSASDVYSTYVNGYQYQYEAITARDVIEYTVNKMWEEVEAKRSEEQNPDQDKGEEFYAKHGIR